MNVGSMLVQWFEIGAKVFMTVQSGSSEILVIEQDCRVAAESGV